jgi:hypothetical protein
MYNGYALLLASAEFVLTIVTTFMLYLTLFMIKFENINLRIL